MIGKRINIPKWLLTGLMLGFVLSACAGEGENDRAGDVQLIQDMTGREVAVPEEVNRVIGLRAGALRMLAYLDAIDLVAAIEEPERTADRPYLMAYPELRERPGAGPLMGGDLELIVSARPDVIFMTFTSRGQADELQRRTGIPVIALDYGDFSHRREIFFDSLKLMATVIGKIDRADELVSYIQNSLQKLQERTESQAENEVQRVYIGGVSYSGTQGISSTEPYYPPFRFLGVKNVAEELDERRINPIQGTFIDKEQLILWNPDVLFVDLASLSITGSEISRGTPLYVSLKALQQGQVYGMLPYNNYSASYENILANGWYAGKVLFPDAFSDIDPDKKTDEIFEAFLGKPVYEELKEVWGGFRQLDGELL